MKSVCITAKARVLATPGPSLRGLSAVRWGLRVCRSQDRERGLTALQIPFREARPPLPLLPGIHHLRGCMSADARVSTTPGGGRLDKHREKGTGRPASPAWPLQPGGT